MLLTFMRIGAMHRHGLYGVGVLAFMLPVLFLVGFMLASVQSDLDENFSDDTFIENYIDPASEEAEIETDGSETEAGTETESDDEVDAVLFVHSSRRGREPRVLDTMPFEQLQTLLKLTSHIRKQDANVAQLLAFGTDTTKALADSIETSLLLRARQTEKWRSEMVCLREARQTFKDGLAKIDQQLQDMLACLAKLETERQDQNQARACPTDWQDWTTPTNPTKRQVAPEMSIREPPQISDLSAGRSTETHWPISPTINLKDTHSPFNTGPFSDDMPSPPKMPEL